MRPSRQLLTLLWIVAAMAAAFNILGALHVPHIPVLGFSLDEAGTVTDVAAGGAGASAGLRVGDRIQRIDGEDYRAGAEKPPSLRAGTTQELDISRDDVHLVLKVTAGSLSPRDQLFGFLFGISGLFFVLVGPLLYQRSGSVQALTLAATGICLGPAQGYRPLASTTLGHELLVFTYGALGVLCTALLVHFVLVFPKPWQAATHRGWLTLLYGPPLAKVVLEAAVLIVPGAAAALQPVISLVSAGGQLYLAHALALSILLVVRYRESTTAETERSGLGVLFYGTLAVIVPILLAALWLMVAPDPDADFLQYAFVPSLALPVIFAYPVWRNDRAGRRSSLPSTTPGAAAEIKT